jgi:hypothetical protein
MPGIKRKSLLATNLRVQTSSCPKMAEASFVQRSRSARATFRSRRRFAVGYPTFMTVHLHNSAGACVKLDDSPLQANRTEARSENRQFGHEPDQPGRPDDVRLSG